LGGNLELPKGYSSFSWCPLVLTLIVIKI
jgi:hypothetical protein